MLQDHLVQAGASIAVDGIFGPITRKAVVAFQRAAHLASDGIVGTKTWGALKTGVTTIDVGGVGLQAADVAERVASRLQTIAARLAPLANGVEAASSNHALGAFSATTTTTDAGAAGSGAPAASKGEGSTTDEQTPAAVVDAAAEVVELLGDPTVQDVLGPVAGNLGGVATGLSKGSVDEGKLGDALVQLDTVASDVGEAVANHAGAQTETGSSRVDVVSDVTYKITADDIAGVGQALSDHMAIHGEAAHVAPHGEDGGVTLDLEMSAQGRVVKATVTLELERVLPEWTKAGSTKCSCWKAEWDRFDAAIRAHEQQHVNLFKKFFTGLHLKLVGKTEAAANQTFDDVFERCENAQDTFDTTTTHGQTPPPGTSFNAGKPCTC